jgi:hypothetical protein
MSGLAAPPSGWLVTDIGTVPATPAGTTVTCGASNNQKGSYAPLCAATPFDGDAGVMMNLWGPSGGGNTTSILADLAVGPAGSEEVIAPNFFYNMCNQRAAPYLLPIYVAGGSRVAARGQSSVGGTTFAMSAHIMSGGWHDRSPLGNVITYNADVSQTLPLSGVDPGAAGAVKGTWVQFSPAVDADLKAFVLSIGQASSGITFLGSTGYIGICLDIGIGAAGSEEIVVPDLRFYMSGADSNSVQGSIVGPHYVGPYDVLIPKGARLAVRAMANTVGNATQRVMGFVFHGITS